MTALAKLQLKQAYHKPEDDIAKDFYLPCLAAAKSYDRAVGYFSSAIYVLAWPSLVQFVKRGGKIRLICSPVLSIGDTAAMQTGYSAREAAAQGERLNEEFTRILESPGTHKPAKVLASLVALGIIDIRIAWVGDSAGAQPRRLFHDKVGIFSDEHLDAIVFKGSMNETWPGLASDGNLESVDVFLSWAGGREAERVIDEKEYFSRLWGNVMPGVTTMALPDVTHDIFVKASDPHHWPQLVEDICIEIDNASKWCPNSGGAERVPRPHQVAALDAWQARGRRGIFEHATGSGKTFTALCAISDSLAKGEVVLILVPSELLLVQWTREIRSTFSQHDVRLLICGGGNASWREEGRLRAWTRNVEVKYRVVLATIQTASTDEFLKNVRAGKHIFMVADEAHRLGAPQARGVLDLDTGPRLALSATPVRSGDPEGTAALFDYFNGVVPPPFTLADAIKAGTLTPYVYHVHQVSLEDDEQELWTAATTEIRKVAARLLYSAEHSPQNEGRLKLLLIQRARIIKTARKKIQKAVELVLSDYRPGQHWIVYCEDQWQLRSVREALNSARFITTFEYHSSMSGAAEQTLALFTAQGGVIVSIRCLDEGVDIPAVSHALILASSKNPREFVQRRGRVLRKFTGKHVSHVYDVLVTPLFDPDEPPSSAILEGELARAIEFGSYALNPGCISDLQRLAIEHGIDWERLKNYSLGEDEDDNE
ncbi:DEAD/DEAH box helicase family protein [Massilia timonae]|uniref:DEAD/DEAH box helicase family protein n=1 Tax=Massilia timonae TaxID=47229 RepID=UPI0023549C64